MLWQAFERGFLMLFAGPAIHLFSATELERLVCGTPLLDFSALQRSARYDGGYHPQHQVSAYLRMHSRGPSEGFSGKHAQCACF